MATALGRPRPGASFHPGRVVQSPGVPSDIRNASARGETLSSARPAPVELVAEGDMRFADEERALLHARLRAATFLLSVGFVLVLVRDLAFGRGPAWPLQAAAIVVMVLLATLLSAARILPARA